MEQVIERWGRLVSCGSSFPAAVPLEATFKRGREEETAKHGWVKLTGASFGVGIEVYQLVRWCPIKKHGEVKRLKPKGKPLAACQQDGPFGGKVNPRRVRPSYLFGRRKGLKRGA